MASSARAITPAALARPRLRAASRQRPAHERPRPRHLHTTPALRAQLIRRPHRPYTFTQLLALSDGSTAVHRTTSPVPVYRSPKDARNSPLWNPSNALLAAVEEDEAGKLSAFRARFGRAFDAAAPSAAPQGVGAAAAPQGDVPEKAAVVDGVGARVEEPDAAAPVGAHKESTTLAKAETDAAAERSEWTAEEEEENLIDIISSYGRTAGDNLPKGSVATSRAAGPKKKKR